MSFTFLFEIFWTQSGGEFVVIVQLHGSEVYKITKKFVKRLVLKNCGVK